MFIFSSRPGLALVLAALCPSGQTAHAQAAPVPYWIPSWVGFGGDLTAGQSFDGRDTDARYNFSNGWFVGGERGVGLSMNGINQDGAFGNIGSLYYQGVQYGYNFQIARGLPLTVYAGFDTLKYNTGFGAPIAPFDTMSGTLPGYGAHAGIEFKPTSNVSLSLGFGYTQQ